MTSRPPAGGMHLHRMRAKTRPDNVLRVMIEGEHLTFAQIAERLGCTADRANRRVRRLQAAKRPLTWDTLKCTPTAG